MMSDACHNAIVEPCPVPPRRRRPSSVIKVSLVALNNVRLKLSIHSKRIDDRDYVELSSVLDLLSKLQV